MRPQSSGLVMCLLAMAVSRAAIGGEQPTAPAAQSSKVAEFFAARCVHCHSGSEPEGELSFEPFADGSAPALADDAARRALDQLRAGTMPPESEERPPAEERAAAVAWLEGQVARHDASIARPGRVRMRRLNRAEYNYTIQDLFGIDLRPADDFPADEVGYGFDNIADVLAMPPVLVERYLRAAERIAETVILAPETYRPPRRRIEAESFMALDGVNASTQEGWHILASEGEIASSFDVRVPGQYRILVKACGDQAGPDPARLALRLARDGQPADQPVIDISAPRDRPEIYPTNLRLAAGHYDLRVAFLNDFYQPGSGDAPTLDRNLRLDFVEVVGPLALVKESLPSAHREIVRRHPRKTRGDWEAAARESLVSLVPRVYRRPVSSEEIERLVAIVAEANGQGESFERGLQWALVAMLTSPQFLFHVESKPETQVHEIDRESLDDFAVANRLSYFLWSSLPDEALFARAASGELSRPEVLVSEARRLLADPRSARFIESFGGQWLLLRNLDRMTPDPQRFPEFDDEFRAAMWGETRNLLDFLMRQDGSVLDLLDADYTFLNERLARHYGITDVVGPEFRRVELHDRRRGGLLGQAGVLTVTSNPTRTSPVKRGKWVLQQLLGEQPPTPPPGVPPLADDGRGPLAGTLRQRMEQHRADPACASCHRRMDAVGFGLENFDAIGAWRDREGETPIDAGAELAPGEAFTGPAELKALLRARPDGFYRTLAEKLLTYALGRGLELHDRAAVDKIAHVVAADEGRFSTLITAIVTSEPFRLRSAEEQP